MYYLWFCYACTWSHQKLFIYLYRRKIQRNTVTTRRDKHKKQHWVCWGIDGAWERFAVPLAHLHISGNKKIKKFGVGLSSKQARALCDETFNSFFLFICPFPKFAMIFQNNIKNGIHVFPRRRWPPPNKGLWRRNSYKQQDLVQIYTGRDRVSRQVFVVVSGYACPFSSSPNRRARLIYMVK